MGFGFKTYSTTEASSGFSANSEVLNSSVYQILDKKQTTMLDCGLALINMKEDYYCSYRNDPISYKFNGKNIGFAFVVTSKAHFEAAYTPEMAERLQELCFKHNVELTKWKNTSPQSTVKSLEDVTRGASPQVVNDCVFMKPSIGIKAVWDEFNDYLKDYSQRLGYVLKSNLDKAKAEEELLKKEEQSFQDILSMLRGNNSAE